MFLSANAERFSKFFHQVIRKKILGVYMTHFHLIYNVLLHYLVKVENPKNVTDFDSTSANC